MKRQTELRLHNAPTPISSISGPPLQIPFALRSAFHDGYIDIHDRPPENGNPLFSEYFSLLEHGPELRFQAGAFGGDKDHRNSESHRLGRVFARAYLSQHADYTWFAHTSNLKSAPRDGWQALPLGAGDMPDWVVAGSKGAAVAEAKGTRHNVTASNGDVTKWRKQLVNIRVSKNAVPVRLKGWIVANRWVDSSQPRTLPLTYVEDPEIAGDRELGDDLPSLLRWVAGVHTARNLSRVGLRLLAMKLIGDRSLVAEIPRVRAILWECLSPQLRGRRFIGSMNFASQKCEPYNWHWPWLWECRDEIRGEVLELLLIQHTRPWFDGVDAKVITDLLHDRVPETEGPNTDLPVDMSLLRDGSLIAPGELMRPVEVVEL